MAITRLNKTQENIKSEKDEYTSEEPREYTESEYGDGFTQEDIDMMKIDEFIRNCPVPDNI